MRQNGSLLNGYWDRDTSSPRLCARSLGCTTAVYTAVSTSRTPTAEADTGDDETVGGSAPRPGLCFTSDAPDRVWSGRGGTGVPASPASSSRPAVPTALEPVRTHGFGCDPLPALFEPGGSVRCY